MATVHCIIETNPDTGFAGWVVGFTHFAVTGSTPEEVETKLQSTSRCKSTMVEWIRFWPVT
jgi:hypothetical protein